MTTNIFIIYIYIYICEGCIINDGGDVIKDNYGNIEKEDNGEEITIKMKIEIDGHNGRDDHI